MLGDKGPLTFVRTEALLGSPPPAKEPLRDEFELLKTTNPRKLAEDERAFLAKFGVVKSSGLGMDPTLLLLGEPHLVERGGTRLIVSRVLNSEIKSWPRAKGDGSGRVFDDSSKNEGFYPGHPLVDQYYVHDYQSGVDFYNYITACVTNDGILFNTHSESFGQAVFHELLHTFEGEVLKGSTILKEGITEKYSRMFATNVYGLAIGVYSPYAMYYEEAEKLIRLTSLETVAKAYFADDLVALKELVPYFYAPINASLPGGDQLNSLCVQEAAKTQTVKGFLSPYGMKAKDSWYREWCSANNGTPPNGLALPPLANPPKLGGFP